MHELVAKLKDRNTQQRLRIVELESAVQPEASSAAQSPARAATPVTRLRQLALCFTVVSSRSQATTLLCRHCPSRHQATTLRPCSGP